MTTEPTTIELPSKKRTAAFITDSNESAAAIQQIDGAIITFAVTEPDDVISLVETIGIKKDVWSIVLAFSNDTAGRKITADFKAALKGIGVNCHTSHIGNAKGHKDAATYLQEDPEGLQQEVTAAIHATTPAGQYRSTSAGAMIHDFTDSIRNSVNTPCTPTGFKALDRILDGGLYPGLYGIGAVSSLGKTSFVLQIADQIAQAGRDVLFFSLEMAASELMGKSISRLTFEKCAGYPGNAKTTRGILDGRRYKNYSDTETTLINRAIIAYTEYAHHIYFTEGMGVISVEKIKDTVAKHRAFTDNSPVVIVDYLQLLTPHSDHLSDKQNIDRAVTGLKCMSRDNAIPVIIISSLNRGSYHGPVTFEAFKESGAIEYSCDVVIGLQPPDLKISESDKTKTENKAAMIAHKSQVPRQMEAVILKNRNGATQSSATYTYDPRFNSFKEGASNTGAASEPTPF